MAKQAEPVTVFIRQRTLFIGTAAYPLQGIVGISPVTLVVNKWVAFKEFLGWLVVPLAFAFAGFTGAVDRDVAIPVAGLIALVLLIVLLARLTRPPLHVLRIQNAAGSFHLLFSEQHDLVEYVMSVLVNAIETPTITYGPIHMTNINAGRDYVMTAGQGNLVTTGSGG